MFFPWFFRALKTLLRVRWVGRAMASLEGRADGWGDLSVKFGGSKGLSSFALAKARAEEIPDSGTAEDTTPVPWRNGVHGTLHALLRAGFALGWLLTADHHVPFRTTLLVGRIIRSNTAPGSGCHGGGSGSATLPSRRRSTPTTGRRHTRARDGPAVPVDASLHYCAEPRMHISCPRTHNTHLILALLAHPT